jgi:hypothetical protein
MIKLAMQSTTIESENDPHSPRNQYVDDEADHDKASHTIDDD